MVAENKLVLFDGIEKKVTSFCASISNLLKIKICGKLKIPKHLGLISQPFSSRSAR